jgi:hypothetical protein
MTLVIFGERPGPNTDPERPLYPHTTTGAAARLIRLLGMSENEYLSRTIRYNVVKEGSISTAEPDIRREVRGLLAHHRLDKETRFIFLGRSAANAAPPEFRNLEFCQPLEDVMIIPHTSGRNRFYNSEANVRLVEESLRKFTRRF